MRHARRIRFTDPEPLGPDDPEWASNDTRRAGVEAKKRADAVMVNFDWLPASVRHVEWVTGNTMIAGQLVRDGYDTPERAEPIVRRMLEQQAERQRIVEHLTDIRIRMKAASAPARMAARCAGSKRRSDVFLSLSPLAGSREGCKSGFLDGIPTATDPIRAVLVTSDLFLGRLFHDPRL